MKLNFKSQFVIRRSYVWINYTNLSFELCNEPDQTSAMNRFTKVVNQLQPMMRRHAFAAHKPAPAAHKPAIQQMTAVPMTQWFNLPQCPCKLSTTWFTWAATTPAQALARSATQLIGCTRNPEWRRSLFTWQLLQCQSQHFNQHLMHGTLQSSSNQSLSHMLEQMTTSKHLLS